MMEGASHGKNDRNKTPAKRRRTSADDGPQETDVGAGTDPVAEAVSMLRRCRKNGWYGRERTHNGSLLAQRVRGAWGGPAAAIEIVTLDVFCRPMHRRFPRYSGEQRKHTDWEEFRWAALDSANDRGYRIEAVARNGERTTLVATSDVFASVVMRACILAAPLAVGDAGVCDTCAEAMRETRSSHKRPASMYDAHEGPWPVLQNFFSALSQWHEAGGADGARIGSGPATRGRTPDPWRWVGDAVTIDDAVSNFLEAEEAWADARLRLAIDPASMVSVSLGCERFDLNKETGMWSRTYIDHAEDQWREYPLASPDTTSDEVLRCMRRFFIDMQKPLTPEPGDYRLSRMVVRMASGARLLTRPFPHATFLATTAMRVASAWRLTDGGGALLDHNMALLALSRIAGQRQHRNPLPPGAVAAINMALRLFDEVLSGDETFRRTIIEPAIERRAARCLGLAFT
jgi:hypothetical protein